MKYRCPVCFFAQLPYPPQDYEICPCCGTEFGNDDVEFGYDELRANWIGAGGHWFFGQPPANWNPWAQVAAFGYGLRTGEAGVRAPLNKITIRDRKLQLQLA